MLSLKTAQERRDAAERQLQEAHVAAIAADDAIAAAKRQLEDAEDVLYQAKWGSVPCPVCKARRGQHCRLERDAPKQAGKSPGVLHNARVRAAYDALEMASR